MNTPANTPDATIAGAKREPSSLVQITTSTGCSRLDAVIVERADHFEPAEHAVDAVEAAAGRLRVGVRAGDDRQAASVACPRGA